MALSGSYDFTLTAAQLIAAAYRKINISSASSTQNTNALQALELLLKSFNNEGFNLVFPWIQEEITQALVASTASYTLNAKVFNIDQAWIRDSDGFDTPVTVIGKEEYFALGSKSSVEGRPSQLWPNKQIAAITVTLYPVPDDATDVLHMLAVNKFQDVDSDTNNVDVTPAWFRALVYLLAAEIAPEENILTAEVDRLLLVGERLKSIAMAGTSTIGSVFISQERR